MWFKACLASVVRERYSIIYELFADKLLAEHSFGDWVSCLFGYVSTYVTEFLRFPFKNFMVLGLRSFMWQHIA